ncbi:alpha/beta fold hydrolase [Streptomyces sp. PRKS01-65]|nr:alpha/beta fold hydrolase [Streptomyces harenosi]NEY36079.1 alpha/beta fold hydrolase [Streptomyces harenosi]
MTDSREHARWFRVFHETPDHARPLVCFPHAGGAAGYYHRLSAALAPAVRVAGVQYPGRQDRLGEPAVTDLTVLADTVAALLARRPGPPPVLFGHSMGALIAFEVAARLEHRHGRAPAGLVVSAMSAPHRCAAEAAREPADDAAAAEELLRLGGTDPQILADEEVRALVLSVLRGDYRAVRGYRPGSVPAPLSCPLAAFTGLDDELDAGAVRAWSGYTTAPFSLRGFPGGHFYLDGFPPAVTGAVREAVLVMTGAAPAAGSAAGRG